MGFGLKKGIHVCTTTISIEIDFERSLGRFGKVKCDFCLYYGMSQTCKKETINKNCDNKRNAKC